MELLCKIMRENGVGVVKDSKNEPTMAVDVGVYDKKRNFRCFLSSKFGKNAVLKYDEKCGFYGKMKNFLKFLKKIFFSDRTPSKYQIFLDSLVIPVSYKKFEVYDLGKFFVPAPKPVPMVVPPKTRGKKYFYIKIFVTFYNFFKNFS